MPHISALRRCGGFIFIAMLVTAAACARDITGPLQPLTGCYALETSAWSGGESPVAGLPDTVQLLATRGMSAPEAGHALVRAYPDSLWTPYRWSWWEVAAPDTLKLVFSTGTAGVRLTLRPDGERFTGRAVTFTDDLASAPGAAYARLRPIGCSGP